MIIERKLQKVKDQSLLKNWRKMYRKQSHDGSRKKGAQTPATDLAMSAPFGMGE